MDSSAKLICLLLLPRDRSDSGLSANLSAIMVIPMPYTLVSSAEFVIIQLVVGFAWVKRSAETEIIR
jgi:hypothetical protein